MLSKFISGSAKGLGNAFGRSSKLSKLSPYQSRANIHTGNLPPNQQHDMAQALIDSPHFRQLNARIDAGDEAVFQQIRERTAKMIADHPKENYPDYPTEEKLNNTQAAHFALAGKIASVNLHYTKNFIDQDDPNKVNVLSAQREHVPKVAHEMQHLDDNRKYGKSSDSYWPKLKEVLYEYRAFRSQKKVADEMGIAESGVPYESPFRAALTYWNKSASRKNL